MSFRRPEARTRIISGAAEYPAFAPASRNDEVYITTVSRFAARVTPV